MRFRKKDQVTHVEGLVFMKVGPEYMLVLVYPEKAAQKGGSNRTIPGGATLRLTTGGRFEKPNVAMIRELKQETGLCCDDWCQIFFQPLGEPIDHSTGQHEVKRAQGYVIVLKKQHLCPTLPGEIRAVECFELKRWVEALSLMNPRKRLLVEELLARAEASKGLPTRLRDQIRTFKRTQARRPITSDVSVLAYA